MDVGKVYRGRVVGIIERALFILNETHNLQTRSLIEFQDTESKSVLSVEVVGRYKIGTFFNVLITRNIDKDS